MAEAFISLIFLYYKTDILGAGDITLYNLDKNLFSIGAEMYWVEIYNKSIKQINYTIY